MAAMKTEAPLNIPKKLKEFAQGLVTRHNELKAERPDLGLTTYALEDGLRALDEHRKAAFAQIDLSLEAGRISPEESQRRKDKWDILHCYKQ